MNNAHNTAQSSISWMKSQQRNGFALIASLSIMVLLVMITVGMLTLSTSEVRQSSQAKYQLEAQANARMALTIALGELQKYVGHDQRVTARADIHEGVSDDKKYVTGVWSTEQWDPLKPDQKKLLKWLATIPVQDELNPDLTDVESPVKAFSSALSSVITVVGKGSLGDSSDQSDHVKVATVPLMDSSGSVSGTYAYWVSDEASKASYAVPNKTNPETWNEAAKVANAKKTGVEVLDNSLFEGYSELIKTKAGNSPSHQSIDVVHSATTKASQQYFHHLTNRSVSLFTNTRHGGMKSDLSTAFELDFESFNAIDEFHDSTERNDTSNYSNLSGEYNKDEFYPSSHKLGYLFEVPANSSTVVRGPTWDLLRNHYRLYKKEWENFDWKRKIDGVDADNFATRGTLPLSYSTSKDSKTEGAREYGFRSNLGAITGNNMKNSDDPKNFKDIAEPIANGAYDHETGTLRTTAARIAPSIIRVTMVIGVRMKSTGLPAPKDKRLALSLDPYVTIHNPYNRSIEFESIGMYSAKFNPVRFNITYTKVGETEPTEPLKDLGFASNYNNAGGLAYRLLPSSGQTFTLQPGEVKVLTPKSNNSDGSTQEYDFKNQNIVQATFQYGENSGIYAYPRPPLVQKDKEENQIYPNLNEPITIEMYGRAKNAIGKNEADSFTFSLLSSKDHNGQDAELDTLAPPYMDIRKDVFDDALITRLVYSTYADVTKSTVSDHPIHVSREFLGSSIPPTDGDGAGYVIAALDMRMKNGTDDAPPFHQFSPRAQIYDLRNYDGSDRIGPTWKLELLKITDISDSRLSLGDPHWGGGITPQEGSKKVVLFDLPRSPLTSLASLSHADITSMPSDGAAPIGNSFAHSGLKDLNKIIGKRSMDQSYRAKINQTLTDFSWAANEALWDQYYFSSINWGSSTLAFDSSTSQSYPNQAAAVTALIDNDSTQKSPMLNQRVQYAPQGITNNKLQSELEDYKAIGKHLSVVGGFNVNSTSQDAWAAVLGALKGEEIKYLANSGNVKSSSPNSTLSRFTLPAGQQSDEWAGFRDLSDKEIKKLAEAMVVQVKARGPFIGLSDFVNRSLTDKTADSTEIGKLGAIQAAIESSGLNDSMAIDVTTANLENTIFQIDGKKKTLSTLTGVPGYLMQSDVLTSIGCILRTRSDTFLVRTYGDARDSTGKIRAKAWCEATIQRASDWVEPTNETLKIKQPYDKDLSSKTIRKQWAANPAFPLTNKTYGRKMKIVSFRWLSKDEV